MQKIGLNKHIVELIPHQSIWKEIYNGTREELIHLIGPYVHDIQHVGSTSIVGIMAKPIIDIAIAIPEVGVIEKIVPLVEPHGYEYRGDGGKEGGHKLVKSIAPEVRTHHIHIVELQDEQWENYLFFRDELNRKKELAEAYMALKLELEIKYKHNRRMYTASKHDFIRKVLNSKP